MEQKVWKLMLNPMKQRTEALDTVAWSEDKDLLLKWYNSQLVDFYIDIVDYGPRFGKKRWNKCFAEGSILEWYNKMDYADGSQGIFGNGLHHEVLEPYNQGKHITLEDLYIQLESTSGSFNLPVQ